MPANERSLARLPAPYVHATAVSLMTVTDRDRGASRRRVLAPGIRGRAGSGSCPPARPMPRPGRSRGALARDPREFATAIATASPPASGCGSCQAAGTPPAGSGPRFPSLRPIRFASFHFIPRARGTRSRTSMTGRHRRCWPPFWRRGTSPAPRLRLVLNEYADHYNVHRPHRTLCQSPPAGRERPPTMGPNVRVLGRDRLGGLIREYAQVA